MSIKNAKEERLPEDQIIILYIMDHDEEKWIDGEKRIIGRAQFNLSDWITMKNGESTVKIQDLTGLQPYRQLTVNFQFWTVTEAQQANVLNDIRNQDPQKPDTIVEDSFCYSED